MQGINMTFMGYKHDLYGVITFKYLVKTKRLLMVPWGHSVPLFLSSIINHDSTCLYMPGAVFIWSRVSFYLPIFVNHMSPYLINIISVSGTSDLFWGL